MNCPSVFPRTESNNPVSRGSGELSEKFKVCFAKFLAFDAPTVVIAQW